MRKLLWASAALLGVATAMPAGAQTTTPAPDASQSGMSHAGTMAPMLPADGSPEQYLRVAQDSLRMHRAREAEDALARAETRLLDRSVPASAANTPDSAPVIGQIRQARAAIGTRDWQQAQQSIDSAMKSPGLTARADAGEGGMNGMPGAMGSQGMTGNKGMMGNQGMMGSPGMNGSPGMSGNSGMGGTSTDSNGGTVGSGGSLNAVPPNNAPSGAGSGAGNMGAGDTGTAQ